MMFLVTCYLHYSFFYCRKYIINVRIYYKQLVNMKKIFLVLSLSVISILCNAQLTEGKYNILSVKGFMNEKTIYENQFDENDAFVRVTPKMINIVIKGYSAITCSVSSPTLSKGFYIYNAKEVQSGAQTTILWQRSDEYPDFDGGLLIVNRSDNYSDIFLISKENSTN